MKIQLTVTQLLIIFKSNTDTKNIRYYMETFLQPNPFFYILQTIKTKEKQNKTKQKGKKEK